MTANKRPRKGEGIAFFLPTDQPEPNADGSEASSQPASTVSVEGHSEGSRRDRDPRSGVAMILMGEELTREFEATKERLRIAEGKLEEGAADPVILNASLVRPSRYANRHESHFKTKEFTEFKAELAATGGNQVPIKVRRITSPEEGGPLFEIVYGHRRHRGCLEQSLPLKAIVEEVDDVTLFKEMDTENRGRQGLSAWEQGDMYVRGLAGGLFSNQRDLAAKLGVSAPLVSRAVSIGELPKQVVECFSSPIVISFRMGTLLSTAYANDPDMVLQRAGALLIERPKITDAEVLNRLVSNTSSKSQPPAHELSFGGKAVGSITVAKRGTVKVDFSLPPLQGDRRLEFAEELQRLVERFSAT